ncbi:hypothetical protein PHMEG_00034796 [Phytophthora megakarya]|uniref:Uncharacterized protein n=1 Tax=Phytophthora megakarya TaxID=4795 RepID=A0A225UQ18_9STRA|nr:hypothetical protein PHMEG_00034796 [Phytophthora megakarya]
MSALALRDAGNMGVKEEQESLLDDSRFVDYQRRAETHMETQRRQHLDEMAAFKKEFQTLRLERDQEREANKNLQSFLVGRLRKQAERRGVCDNGLKPVPEVTTQVYANSDSTVGKPVPSGVNIGVPPVLRKQMVPPEVKTLYATQTQVALRDLDETKENVARAATVKAATTTAVKTEAATDVRKAPVEGKPRKRIYGLPDDEPSDDDNDSDKDSGDSDSDSSSFEDLASGTQARATSQGTIMFNPMVNITALEDFDEKQPLAVYYCKLKLSSAVRDWRGNLDESVRRSWKRFGKAFREEYYKELNKIAGKADIDVKSTDIARDRHLKVFIKKLKDTQLINVASSMKKSGGVTIEKRTL